jgi:hypothetical protein
MPAFSGDLLAGIAQIVHVIGSTLVTISASASNVLREPTSGWPRRRRIDELRHRAPVPNSRIGQRGVAIPHRPLDA